jgi:hypothetical protein
MGNIFENQVEFLKEKFKPICKNKTFNYALSNVRKIDVDEVDKQVFSVMLPPDGRMKKERAFYSLWKSINNEN